MKPRSVIKLPETSKSATVPPFQEDDISVTGVEVQITDEQVNLVDLSAEEDDVDDEEYEEEEVRFEGDKQLTTIELIKKVSTLPCFFPYVSN